MIKFNYHKVKDIEELSAPILRNASVIESSKLGHIQPTQVLSTRQNSNPLSQFTSRILASEALHNLA